MDVVQVAVETVTKAVDVMSRKMSALIKAKMDEKADISEVPVKVSDLTNDSNFQNAQQVEDKIDAKISSAYKAGGSATMATLPALTAAKLGVVVNMSEDFTTTADFLEGAGKTYPAGTNIVVASAGENAYKYDVLAGFVDLSGYVEDTRKIGNVPLSADIPVALTGDTAITVTNTGTASAIGYSVVHKDSGVTAGSKGDTTNQTPGFGGTFKVLSATVDAKGHVTSLGDHTVKAPSDTATVQADGLMSKTDKAKLDGIEAQANKTIVDATLSNTGQAADAKTTGDNFSALRDLIGRMEIHCTASGNPATFSDADAANVKDLRVTITPTQSGSGDPSPSNIRPIFGASSVSVRRTRKNLLEIPDFSINRNGVTAVCSDGVIKLSGTATALTQFGQAGYGIFPPGRYILSGCPAGGSFTTYDLRLPDFDGSPHIDHGSGHTFDWPGMNAAISIYPTIRAGTNTNGLIFRPMIRRASDTDPTFEPYQGQAVSVTLVDSNNNPLTVYGGTLDVTTGALTVTHKRVEAASIPFDPHPSISGRIYADSLTDSLFSTNPGESGYYYCEGMSNAYSFRASSFELTNGQFTMLYSPDLSGSGCRVTIIDQATSGLSKAEIHAYLETAGIYIVYPLASPVTYQLTPQQLATLHGYNAVSADAGTLDVIYKADTSITFGGA